MVTLEIEGVAVAVDAAGVAAPAAAPMPQQPPPPPHPPGNHAMQQRDIMETKVTVLETQSREIVATSEVMSRTCEERMIKMQLALEVKMEEQEQRMTVRMDIRDDHIAMLEREVETMSKTIEELQLALEEKGDRQENCEEAYEMPQEELKVQWNKVKSRTQQDEERIGERIPHENGRMMSNGMMMR